MKSKSKNFSFQQILSKKLIIGFLLVIFFYFFNRLYQLTILPIFCDEAIYIRWAQIIKNEPTLRFIPLTDGKQPLFMWLTAILLKAGKDPLFTGRFVSVLAGFAEMLGVGYLSYLIFKKKSLFFLSILIYLISPFNLFFNRMALVDGLLSAFATWSLIFAILLARKTGLRWAILLGFSLGFGWLTKSPMIFFICLAPLLAFIVGIKEGGVNFKNISSCLKLFFLIGGALFLAFLLYNLLRLDPSFHMIALRNKDYVWSINEILKHPLDPLGPHLNDIIRYYSGYLTKSLFFLGLIGLLVMVFKRKTRFLALLLFTWWFVPLFIQAAMAKVFTARYIFFSVPVFLLFISFGLDWLISVLKKLIPNLIMAKILTVVIIFLFLFKSLIFNWHLLTNPSLAPLPRDERKGYLEDWTAGWGIKEISEYIKEIARKNTVVVSTEGFFGTLPNGLQIYVESYKNIAVIGYTVPVREIPESLKKAKKFGDKTYLVANESRLEIADKSNLQLIEAFEKPGGDRMLFFEHLGGNQD